MRKLNSSLLFVIFLLSFSSYSFSQDEAFSMRQVACGLSQPWEITFGPDGYLWATEAHSYQITRINPATGSTQLVVDLSGEKNFPNFNEAEEWPQGGLMGMAFHPDFENHPYFYVAYVFRFGGCMPQTQGCFFQTKIVRYDYDMNTQSLSNEMVISDTIPGSTDHNGGRMAIGPNTENTGTDFLYYGVGDMGSGHLGNAERAHHGQEVAYYEGKILRFNLTPDNDANDSDSWIPNDNPFSEPGKQSAVWSVGHRNPQGLVFSPDGMLYESEHGPYSDDEINLILPGYNYGFPLIMGFSDGNYNGSKAGAGSTLPLIVSEFANEALIQQTSPYSDPIASFFPAPQSEISTLYTNDINDTSPFDNYYLQYPSVAPSGIDFYGSDAIPGWKNSLLVANLKIGSMYRIQLTNNGTTFEGDTISYFEGMGRFRDLAISADGTKIYLAADSVGSIKGAPGEAVVPPNKGCILEFTYLTTDTWEAALGESVTVFPNPTNQASTQLSIKLADPAEVFVELFTATGQRLVTILPPVNTISFDKTINMAQYQPGIYFLKVQIDGTMVTRKLINL